MPPRRLNALLIGIAAFAAVLILGAALGLSDWIAERRLLFLALAAAALAVAVIAFVELFRGAQRSDAALARLRATAAALVAEVEDPNDLRAAAILDALSEPVLVLNQQAQVTLVNGPAKTLLGAEPVTVGTSVYAALARGSLERALAGGEKTEVLLERVDGEPLEARVVPLAGGEGAILAFAQRPAAAAGGGGLDYDFSLHDRPPPPSPVTDATPLAELPVLVFDCETTGLDVGSDRVVSLGAVRLQGGRIFRADCLDLLVHPGCAIPARSTAIHGITDAMVAQAPGFPEAFPRFLELGEGCVLVGHNLPFDLSMLAREVGLAGLAWERPVGLDTLQLSTVLLHDIEDFSLEALAAHLGVTIRGRHTALGDALVTAEIYARMLPLLAAEGVTSYGQAQMLAARARAILRRQRAAGWL